MSSRKGRGAHLGAGLDVLGDLVVVGSREDREVGETVEGDGVGRGGVAEAEGVAGDGAGRDRVGRLGTEQEAVAADDGVGGEGRALEDVEEGPGVDARLAVDGGDVGRLALGGGEEVTLDVELEALGDLVLEFDLGLEDVRSGPGLGQGDAVLDVRVLGLEVTGDGGRLGVAETGDLERDTVRRAGLLSRTRAMTTNSQRKREPVSVSARCVASEGEECRDAYLDLEGVAGEGEVLVEEVRGRLATVSLSMSVPSILVPPVRTPPPG